MVNDVKPKDEQINGLFESLVSDFNASPDRNKQCLIVVGISGSGKSTTIQNILLSTKINAIPIQENDYRKLHPKLDKFIREIGKNNAHIKTENFANRVVKALSDKAIENEISVIYESTFRSKENTENIVSKFLNEQYEVNIMVLPINVEESIKRNQQRYDEKRLSGETLQCIVSCEAIEDMAGKLNQTLEYIKDKFGNKISFFFVKSNDDAIDYIKSDIRKRKTLIAFKQQLAKIKAKKNRQYKSYEL